MIFVGGGGMVGISCHLRMVCYLIEAKAVRIGGVQSGEANSILAVRRWL